MRFVCDDGYHMDESMVPYKGFYDDHVSCLGNGQVLASMSVWIIGHKRYNREVSTYSERLLTTNGYLRIV